MRIRKPVRVVIFSGSWGRKNQEFIYLNGKMDRWSLVEVKVKPCRPQGQFNAFPYYYTRDKCSWNRRFLVEMMHGSTLRSNKIIGAVGSDLDKAQSNFLGLP